MVASSKYVSELADIIVISPINNHIFYHASVQDFSVLAILTFWSE